MKLVFATNNQHKLKEVEEMVGNSIELLTLNDIDCHTDIPETSNTLEGNASLKSHYIQEHFHINCFADDTGLEIEALNQAPGVYSARYAGEEKNSEANMLKVLNELKGIKNRKARFRTVISLIINDKEYLFEGIVNGKIAEEKHGEAGFGYDPIFIPEGYTKTFAELGEDIKNKISHRAKAIEKLSNFLNQL